MCYLKGLGKVWCGLGHTHDVQHYCLGDSLTIQTAQRSPRLVSISDPGFGSEGESLAVQVTQRLPRLSATSGSVVGPWYGLALQMIAQGSSRLLATSIPSFPGRKQVLCLFLQKDNLTHSTFLISLVLSVNSRTSVLPTPASYLLTKMHPLSGPCHHACATPPWTLLLRP